MQFQVLSSYNLDLLCFINTLTSDSYYLKFYQEDYEKFFPLLSLESKNNIKKIIKLRGQTMISPLLSLYLSSMKDFNSRNILDLLAREEEMKDSFSKFIYYDSDEWDSDYAIIKHVIFVIKDLESKDFYQHWINTRLPLINNKIKELDEYLNNYNISTLIGEFVDFNDEDCRLYLCSYARPHGIKICGNAFISDVSYKKETTISIAIHEMFHPPYNKDNVKDSIDYLASVEEVNTAFINQNPNSGYKTIEGFIEENIVEALGIYVCYKLNIEKDPFNYFKEHDGGSHVISPILFQYLLDNPKDKQTSFDEYFMEFVREKYNRSKE